jgi:hypothetical protein
MSLAGAALGFGVTGLDGGSVTVRYREAEKKIVVPPGVPVMRYEIGSPGDLKPGVSFTVIAASKKPDGTSRPAASMSAATVRSRSDWNESTIAPCPPQRRARGEEIVWDRTSSTS